MCPPMIDPISVLSSLPCRTNPTPPKLGIIRHRDQQMRARGLVELMVSGTLKRLSVEWDRF